MLSLLVVGNRTTRYNPLFFHPLLAQIWSVEEIPFCIDFSRTDQLWGIRLVQKRPRILLDVNAPSPLNSFNSLFDFLCVVFTSSGESNDKVRPPLLPPPPRSDLIGRGNSFSPRLFSCRSIVRNQVCIRAHKDFAIINAPSPLNSFNSLFGFSLCCLC